MDKLFEELNIIIEELKDGDDYHKPINVHSIDRCYKFIEWMPNLNENIEVTLQPTGYLSLSFRNGLDNAEIVFEKDYLIWIRNQNQKITSGKIYQSKYVFFHVLSEVLKIFD